MYSSYPSKKHLPYLSATKGSYSRYPLKLNLLHPFVWALGVTWSECLGLLDGGKSFRWILLMLCLPYGWEFISIGFSPLINAFSGISLCLIRWTWSGRMVRLRAFMSWYCWLSLLISRFEWLASFSFMSFSGSLAAASPSPLPPLSSSSPVLPSTSISFIHTQQKSVVCDLMLTA